MGEKTEQAKQNMAAASATQNNGGEKSTQKVVAAVVFYFIVSLSIVFFNYILFTSTFKSPVFISWFQQVVGLVIVLASGALSKFFPVFNQFFAPYEFKPAVAWKVMPVAVTFVLMIALSNTCLKYVQVSTYQVARSTTIMFNILLMYVILKQATSRQCVAACAVVVLGFIIGSLDPNALTFFGLVAGLLSSVSQAFNTVMVKKTLEYVDGNQNLLLSYNITVSIFLFLPCIWIAGEQTAFALLPWDFTLASTWKLWGALCVSGLLAILINIATFLVIKYTNPVTFNMIAMVKACVQTIGGVLIFGEVLSLQSLTGILLTVAGSYAYGRFKLEESKQLALAQSSDKPAVQMSILSTQTNNSLTTSKDSDMTDLESGRPAKFEAPTEHEDLSDDDPHTSLGDCDTADQSPLKTFSSSPTPTHTHAHSTHFNIHICLSVAEESSSTHAHTHIYTHART
eukprot:GDKI01015889.1.p1 GENE.GDKI01015889.1~~GDKI01015889.1.p1  ORF type:complete len:455 (+),score=144.72 GDKI01015889.1:67-1431(+)